MIRNAGNMLEGATLRQGGLLNAGSVPMENDIAVLVSRSASGVVLELLCLASVTHDILSTTRVRALLRGATSQIKMLLVIERSRDRPCR